MQSKTDNPFCSSFWSRGGLASSPQETLCRQLQPSSIRTMRIAITFAVCLSGLLALPAVCVAQQEFLNPLYTQNELTTDRLLPGIWVKKLDDVAIVLEFKLGKTNCYDLNVKVVLKDSSDHGPYEDTQAVLMNANACLVKLGQMVFLDVQSKRVPVGATTETFHLDQSSGFVHKSSFLPALFHLESGADGDFDGPGLFLTLAPVRQKDAGGRQPKFELRLIPAHWIFRIWIDDKKLQLRDFDPKGEVATLSTRDLQRVVLKHADDSDVFKDGDDLQFQNGGSR